MFLTSVLQSSHLGDLLLDKSDKPSLKYVLDVTICSQPSLCIPRILMRIRGFPLRKSCAFLPLRLHANLIRQSGQCEMSRGATECESMMGAQKNCFADREFLGKGLSISDPLSFHMAFLFLQSIIVLQLSMRFIYCY
jgi:hypothetical protein